MKSLGIIYCCYGNPDYVSPCLEPWLKLKEELNIKIAGVHGQFKEYHDLGMEDNDFDTYQRLVNLKFENKLDFLYCQKSFSFDIDQKIEYKTEAEIRDIGLKYLLGQNVEYVILLDNDEFYTEQNIRNIVNYVDKNPFIDWFSINFKNYVFDGKCWIDGFCPPRIFKVDNSKHRISDIYWDNDINYRAKSTGDIFSYKSFSNKQISRNIAHIKHLTWLHTNGKEKYEYQMKHFGHCGYKWNYETNTLEFNQEFHKKHGIPIPELNYDS